MSLRPYQESAVTAALHALARSGSAVLQMPTGAGKTKAATEIIKRHGKTIWFVCHRQEIERQASRAFSAAGIDHGIVSPRGEAEYGKPVQIVSVATLAKRMADLPAPALVIWDECHHVAAKSWAAIRESLTEAQHLGLTATPERLDGKGLKDWFAELVVGPSISQLIDEGYLSPFRYFAPSDPDLTAAKLQAGDYRKRDADAVMNTPVLIGDAVAEYKRNAAGKRAIAFCTSVEASQALAARFTAEGIPASHVDGTTPHGARTAAVEALAAGDIKVLSNVEVFTEGFDLPGIDAAILMRPTKSPTLLLQMIGRALRVAPGKPEAIIMDHAGLHRDHGWFADNWHWSLDGGAARARRKALERGPRKCPECNEVRAEREPVCACGFEFPTGREIGEFDGVLREIRGEVPEGCETVREFSQRHGVSYSCVNCHWKKRGLPFLGAYVASADADKWVAKHADMNKIRNAKAAAPNGFVRKSAFARMNNVSPSCVEKWISKGMPHIGFHIPVDDALEWVASRRTSGNLTADEVSSGLVSKTTLANKIGISTTSINTLIAEGLPLGADGKIRLDAAVAWVRANNSSIVRMKSKRPPKPTDGRHETRTSFAKRYGFSGSSVINRMAKVGFPLLNNFLIETEAADQWMNENNHLVEMAKNSRRVRVYSRGWVSMSGFARLIGAKAGTVRSWSARARSALPYDRKLGIPIREALEWVRDNRPDIVIPPEAWPAADNDNEATTEAA